MSSEEMKTMEEARQQEAQLKEEDKRNGLENFILPTEKAKKKPRARLILPSGISQSDVAEALCRLVRHNGGIPCNEKDVSVQSNKITDRAISFGLKLHQLCLHVVGLPTLYGCPRVATVTGTRGTQAMFESKTMTNLRQEILHLYLINTTKH